MSYLISKFDGKYSSIAVASVLAKTYRDDDMKKLHNEFPSYDWDHNKGYPTKKHRISIKEQSTTPCHSISSNLLGNAQLYLDL